MLESLLAIFAIILTPSLLMSVPGVWSTILQFIVVFVVTTATSFIESVRLCTPVGMPADKHAAFVRGVKKGLVCGIAAVIASIIVLFIPILRLPFMILSFLPNLEAVIDGIILALGYMVGYVGSYPIWGC